MKTINERVAGIVRHINNVRDNCLLLGERLIGQGEKELGRLLISNGFIHDNSKFHGVEWDHLSSDGTDPELLRVAVSNHNRTNPHHPEYWGGINEMPNLYVAEMVCDWKARSNEFGSSLQDWIDGGAAKKFGYTKDSAVYGSIMRFVGILCDKPLKPLKPKKP